METNQLLLTFLPAPKRQFLDFPLRADFSPVAAAAAAVQTVSRSTRGKAPQPANDRPHRRTFN